MRVIGTKPMKRYNKRNLSKIVKKKDDKTIAVDEGK